MRNNIEAREYKLLLNPGQFANDPSETAEAFWNEVLKPLIDQKLGRRNRDQQRSDGQFDGAVERIVRFWDTESCTLSKADLALRERRTVGDDGSTSDRSEITLKLRTPDLFVAADASLPGTREDADTDFEEDIAPLEVDDPQPGDRAVVVPPEPSIRSRFSLSTSQTAAWRDAHPFLGDLQSLYPTLPDLVEVSGVSFEPTATLIAGPTIRELVFKGTKVRLGADVVGRFALTLWYFEAAGAAPTVAEISFNCTVNGGEMPGRVLICAEN